MPEFTNPPLLSGAPADGQLMKYNASTDSWDPVSAASVGTLLVPQAADAAPSAPSAQTGDAVVLADAVSPANVAYTRADQTALADLVNDLKVEVNATVTDVGTLVTELGALTTAYNDLVEALQDALIIS